jgi:two-component system, LytTR family, sensor kinase
MTPGISRRPLVALFCLLTVIGIVRGLQHFYVVDIYQPVRYGLTWHIPFNLFVWWSWLLFLPLIRRVVLGNEALAGEFRARLIVYFVLPIAIIIVRQAILAIVITIFLSGYMAFIPLLSQRMFSNVWLWLDLGVYFTIVVAFQVMEYRRQEQMSERRFTQLQSELNRSQLNALESQLQPHFLFNTLNTISTLILKTDTPGAERMLSLLQDFLRRTLQVSDRHEVTLDEELRFVNQYLEIERVRFLDRLDIAQTISEEVRSAVVPAFLLQPIVENAVIHGVASAASRARVGITASHEGRSLTIRIQDNGPGLFGPAITRKTKRDGIGLKITRERLAYMYGPDHNLTIENAPEGGVLVCITLPFRQASLDSGRSTPQPVPEAR